MSVSTSTKPATSKTVASAAPTRLLGTPARRFILIIAVIVVAIFFLVAGDDLMTIANDTLVAAIAALALNVLSGYTGQVSLGIAFFMAIGAYTAAWLGGAPPQGPHDPLGLGLSVFIWLPAAGIVAAIAGAIVGPSALRLKDFYLGIVTLALIFIGHHIFFNATGITGGPQGRTFPVPVIGGFSFDQQNDIPGTGFALTSGQDFFLLLLLILTLSALFVNNVMRTRAGRAFQAVRDNEIGASIMGVNLFEAKMGAFIFSSFLAGIAGAMLASVNRYVVPDYWDLTLSIQFIAAIIIGGVASVWGSILGATFVFALPLLIDRFSLLPPSTSSVGLQSGDLNAIIYGVLIFAFLLFEPGGIIGLVRRSQLLTRRSNSSGGEGGDAAETTDVSAPPADTLLNAERPPLRQGDSS